MTLLLIHAAATLCMVGLIWFVQVVHYPLFHEVGHQEGGGGSRGARGFSRYEEMHAARTTWVVLPLMAAELGTAAWLVLNPLDSFPEWWAWAGLGLVLLIWLSTGALQVPCHARLAGGYDSKVVSRLVWTNWVRTLAWTARGVLVLAMIDRVAG